MYVDLIIFIVLLVFVFIYGKRFQTYIFGIISIDIIFRILNFFKKNLPNLGIKNFIGEYFPKSIPSLINKYTSNSVSIILIWIYAIIVIIFSVFILKIFIKRKKIV